MVVGIVQHPKGPNAAPGAEDVAKAYGRKFRPLLTGLGITGKAGEVHRIPLGQITTARLEIEL